MGDREDRNPGESIFERLRREHGTDVDPAISLSTDGGAASDASKGGADDSGVLSRLKTRGAAGSRYRLEGEIARGGMGAILEIWDGDLRRRLAMKVALDLARGESALARPEQLDPRVLARFLEEAQVTGQLEHPGIVPVHELGLDEDGRVFFTMRLVRGRNLDRVFALVAKESEGWSVTRALGVLLKVCEAMGYAHSKGVIHRDLKPANVMVGHFGEVYVMDWGLARVQGHEDRHDPRPAPADSGPESDGPVETDRREEASDDRGSGLYTMDGDVLGTPSYMSPEQARGMLEELDERTDVYALGAMLYRLLGGVAPYWLPGGARPGAVEVLEALLEGPPKPLEELDPDLPAELVAICEKAMERDRADRYADVLELGEDLRAFLEHRVVRAYEGGALAEARKWVRRNRPLAASLAAGVLVLIGGLAVSLVQKGRADESAALAEVRRGEAVDAARLAEERRVEAEAAALLAEERREEALASAAEAQRQARIAEEVNSFLNDDVFAAIAPEHQGIDVTLRQALDVASLRMTGQFGDEPLVESELRMTIGTSYERLGEYDRASFHLERALELRRDELGERAEPTLQAMRGVAGVWKELGRLEEAAELYERALGLLREELGEEHRGVLSTMNDLAIVYDELGRYHEARVLFEDVLETERRVLGDEHEDTLSTLNNLGNLLSDQGRLDEAEEVLREVVELRKRKSGPRHPQTLTAMSNLALVYTEQGRYDESEELQREVQEARVEVLGPDHPDTAVGYGNLGTLYLDRGRYRQAEGMFEKGLAILRRTLGDDNPETLNAASNLAVAYSNQDRLQDALELRTDTLERQRRILGDEHPQTVTSMGNLAMLYRSLGRYAEAEDLQEETLALRRAQLGPDHPDTLVALENLGGLLYARGAYEESLEMTTQVLEARKRILGDAHPDVAKTTYNLAMVASSTGDAALARELFEEALTRNRAALGDVHPNVAECLTQLGHMSHDAEEHAEGFEHYREAARVWRSLGRNDPDVADLLSRAGRCGYESEQPEAAIPILRDALEIQRGQLGDDADWTLVTVYRLAKALSQAERYEEAEPLALEFHDRMRDKLGPEHRHVAKGRELLAELYAAWGQTEQAAKWR